MDSNASENENVTLCAFRSTKANEIILNSADAAIHSIDAVLCENVYVNYTRADFVLRGLNMRVPRGAIYALLGPSGCGKTTLLKCIVGCLRPTRGSIYTFGYLPGPDTDIPGPGVGFMPQEISLYNDMSIEEMLTYIGKLYYMNTFAINTSIDRLVEILDLPEKQRLIATLSGGQIRRVSFATALIHKPPLVILDEPTAGVDPILRDRIWIHLGDLCAENKITFIITTHYIEEARRAHLVGLMRKGRLLAEQPPQVLMAHYNLTTLEDVFLKLCTITKCCSMSLEWQQEQHQLSGDICFRTSLPPMKNNERIALVDIIKKKRVSFNFWQWSIVVSTMARKNMTRYIRHPLILWFQYLLPISQIVLLCICVGGDPFDVRVGIVNDENPVNLSSIFIKSLDFFYIDLRNYSDMQTAIADIKQTKLWGVIHIPANFTQCLGMRVQFDREFENDVINCSTIKIRADQTNKLITLTMERSLEHSYQSFLQAALSEFDLNPRIAQVPIALGETIHGVYGARLHRGFRDHMACGFLTSFTFAVSFALTAIILVLERCDNMFERHFVVGVSTTQLILAHFVSRFLFLIIQVVLSLLVTVYAFELDTRGSLIYAIVSLSLIGFSGLAFGIVLSAICRSIKTLTMLGASFMFFVIFVSGCFWPLEAMPYWFRWFSLTQPTTLPTECLRTILSRGAGISDHRVSSGILVSLAWFALLFFLGYKFFRYN